MFIIMKWYNITENWVDTFWVRLRLGKMKSFGDESWNGNSFTIWTVFAFSKSNTLKIIDIKSGCRNVKIIE